MLLPLRRLIAVCVAVLAASVLQAAEPPIIAKARALIAPDAVLDGVRSLHYVGTLVGPDPADPTKPLNQSIEIFLQKPWQQRIVIKSDKVIEVSALDGYDAWRRITDAKDSTRWQQSDLSADQIKQLRADVWQNLAYFRGIERIGGTVEDQGIAMIDGIRCRKIAFHHSDTIVNYRYFDAASGKLIFTGTPDYNTRERGEMTAGGIRFAKSLIITQTTGGQTITRTLTFDKITVNETFPESLFAVPLPMAN